MSIPLSEASPAVTAVVIVFLAILFLASVASLLFPVERAIDEYDDSYEG